MFYFKLKLKVFFSFKNQKKTVIHHRMKRINKKSLPTVNFHLLAAEAQPPQAVFQEAAAAEGRKRRGGNAVEEKEEEEEAQHGGAARASESERERD